MSSNRRSKDLKGLGIVLLIVIAIAIFSSYFYFRVDLTSDKRYTVKPLTLELIKKSKGRFKVEIFLTGNLDANYERLKQTIIEKCEEIQSQVGDKKFKYYFTDPRSLSDTLRRLKLPSLGVKPVHIYNTGEDGATAKAIFPGAVVQYVDEKNENSYIGTMFTDEYPSGVQQMITEDERFSTALNNIDYAISAAVSKLRQKKRKKIGIIFGHEELKPAQFYEAATRLREFYDIEGVQMNKKKDLTEYDMVLIAKPQKAYGEADRYKLDHYLNQGGKMLVLLEGVQTKMVDTTGLMGLINDVELRDMLFTYGIRVNHDLIQDFNCIRRPIGNGTYQMVPWQFDPIVNNYNKHLITKYYSAETPIWLKEVCTLDTLNKTGVKKTPILFTSSFSKKISQPIIVPFNQMVLEKNNFPQGAGEKAVAYLLEGSFPSHFYRLPAPPNTQPLSFLDKGNPDARLFVISDGDLINPQKGRQKPLPIGYNQYMKTKFFNYSFFKRTIDYMMDEPMIEYLKTTSINYHPLNKKKVIKEKDKMVWLNLLVPPILPIAFFFIIPLVLRKRKRKKEE